MKSFRVLTVVIVCAVIAVFSSATFAQQDDTQKASTDQAAATKKLGAFLGKWNTVGTFASGEKATTELECRWSAQGNYLVCEQHVKLSNGHEQRQLTVYSYNANDGTYQYATFADPGQKPSSGAVEIKGNTWIYNSSFESHGGKTTLIRNTNEFTEGGKTEVFKVVTSDDDGKTWKPLLDGSAHKISD
jgi:type II secretory pathway pseudopilin PulG